MWTKGPFVNRFVASSLTSVGDGMLTLPPLAVWGNLAIYVAAWALLMWPQHLPLGRPCIAMVFAAMACGLRELCHAVWPEEDYPTVDIFGKINPTPIALLFGLMLVNAYLKDTGLWQRVEELLDSESPSKLLFKVCIMAACTSAVLTNDTTCLVLTPVVLNLCGRRGARTCIPFLLAVATSSNIGSSLTIIGNPQNALIASISPGITFLNFFQAMLLPVLVGLAANTLALYLYFRKELVFTSERVEVVEVDVEMAAPEPKCLWRFYLVAVAVIVTAMVVGWVFNMATDDVALAAGSTLMLLRALRRRAAGESTDTETKFALEAIDYSILILFIGQFILVGATVDTGLPQKMFHSILGPCAGDLAAGPGCLLWFGAVVLVLSNIISNVPVILMLQPLLATQPLGSVTSVWTVCAWVATVSGNLTMLGSAANLIVAHSAENQGERGFTATTYSKFSFLPTLLITALGVLVMPPIGPSWSWLLALALLAGLLLAALGFYFCKSWARQASEESEGVNWRNREAVGLFLVSLFAAGQPLGPYEGAWLTANPVRRYTPAELGELNAVQQVLVALMQPLLGGFVDGTRWKRGMVIFASFCAAVSTAVGVFMPSSFWLELATQFPQAVALTLVPLAINSLTLGVTAVGFTQQVALNNVGTHVGTVLCSAAMAGWSLLDAKQAASSVSGSSSGPIWCAVPLSACLLAVAVLPLVRYSKIDHRRAAGLDDEPGRETDFRAFPAETKLGYEILFSRRAFLLSLLLSFLFNFANMAQLQLLVQEAAALLPGQAISYTSAAQVVAHLGMLLSSVAVGHLADRGRKGLILLACLTVTVRALLTAATDLWWIQRGGTPWLGLLPCEGLDGVCAGLWGALVVLLARDVSAGTGCFSLALGCMQAAFSAGAIASSTCAGFLASKVSFGAAFLLLAGAGCAATVVAAILPETMEEEKPRLESREPRCCSFVSKFWSRARCS